jgi:hypothetical protein
MAPDGGSAADAPTAGIAETPGGPGRGLATGPRFVPGTVLGQRFRIVAQLGRGGMGEVYRAEDLRLEQAVALKFLPRDYAADEERLSLLLREVRLAREITHPNVCRVHDFFDLDGTPFVAMEYVDGESLAGLMRRIGRLPQMKALQIAHQITRGLIAAHERRILHRDLKPENVMIDGLGNARLMDFGIASLAGATREENSSGLLVGTPAYMAPEQLRDGTVSERTDVYALGVLLFELFTGRRPFDASRLSELARQHEEELPPALSTLAPELDPAVERVVLQCLEKSPALRPPSVRAVAAALPGGNPLADALAAGVTPPPEVVAAATEGETLRPGRAWTALGATLAALGAFLWLTPHTALLGRLAEARSPASLSERARTILADRGWQAADAGSEHGYFVDWRWLREVGRGRGAARWDAITGHRSPLLFAWHQKGLGPSSTGAAVPVEARVVVDHLGRLVELTVAPSQVPAAPVAPPDWQSLFHLAGLNQADFEPAEASFLPPHFADARSAWTSRPGGLDDPVRVEAASLQGRPVYFRIVRGAPPALPAATSGWSRREIGFAARALTALPPILLAGWMARKNLRCGRGDRTGARRLAGTVLVAGVLMRWLQGEPVWRFDGYELQASGLAEALLQAALAWILYLAAEPYVRRRWPEALVSWTRLLAGSWRDPLVGRDVLLGVLVAGTVCLCLASFRLEAVSVLMPPLVPLVPVAQALSSGSGLLGAILARALSAVAFGLGVLVALVFVRALLRHEGLAVVVTVAAILAPYAVLTVGNPFAYFLVHFVVMMLPALLLRRAGLLAFVVFYFCFNVLFDLVGSCNWETWAGQQALVPVLVVVGLAVWGFWRSLGDHPLLDEALLPD